jgi:hypothetical protein
MVNALARIAFSIATQKSQAALETAHVVGAARTMLTAPKHGPKM